MIFGRNNGNNWIFLTALFLFLLPFFWYKLGEMDLGGDANRLYFYDPASFLRSTATYVVGTEGRGVVEPKYYYLPYVSLIAAIKFLVGSPTLIISIFNGFKLAGSFLGITLIVQDFLRVRDKNNLRFIRIVSVLSGLFYVVSLGSIHMAFFWDRALFTHDQVFLNPIIFYLGFRFITTDRAVYLYLAILVSFIFSTNFGLAAAPAVFGFYPITIGFLSLYRLFILKKIFPWKALSIAIGLFFGVHSFHLLGSIVNLMNEGSAANVVVFNKQSVEVPAVDYFHAVRAHGLAILNLFLPSVQQKVWPFSIFGAIVIVGGLLFTRNKTKDYLLVGLFFLMTFFLATANITSSGTQIYSRLYGISGFSMFRVFFEKWMFVYVFFYSIMVGFGLFFILNRLKFRYAALCCILFGGFTAMSGMPLFTGMLARQDIRSSKSVPGVFVMDPAYEQTMNFIRILPQDGKILVLPLTDVFRQVIYGKNGGAYEGPSPLYHLTNIHSFVGYQSFGYKPTDLAPMAEMIIQAAKAQDYESLKNILVLLNIRYILHNDDPNVYEAKFTKGLYGLMMDHFPETQSGFNEFLKRFPIKIIYENGPFTIYQVEDAYYNPTIYIPETVFGTDEVAGFGLLKKRATISKNECKKYFLYKTCRINQSGKVEAIFETPVSYRLRFNEIDTTHDIFVVMQHTFHKGWRFYKNGKVIEGVTHIPANGYANGFFIPKEVFEKSDGVELMIRMSEQKYLLYGWIISSISLFVVCILLIRSLSVREKLK